MDPTRPPLTRRLAAAALAAALLAGLLALVGSPAGAESVVERPDLDAPTVAPANDDLASATAIAGADGSVTGSNVDATEETGEPSHAGVNALASVWWSWTAPASTNVTFETAGSSFDTVLAAYTGSAVDSLTEVAANDDDPGGGLQSVITFAATAGTTYRIAVAGFGAAMGDIDLAWTSAGGAGPPNDDFPGPTIVGPSGEVDGDNTNATTEPGEPGHGGVGGVQSVWWSWTAPADGWHTFEVVEPAFDSVLVVYTGGAVDDLEVVGIDDDGGEGLASRLNVDATAGTTYRIVVVGFGSEETGAFTLTWGATVPTFPDVPTTHPFFAEIEWMNATGITTGFADGTFKPSAAVTRQAMSAFLFRFAGDPLFEPPGAPSFGDVPLDHPFFLEVEWMASTGITTGFADGTFKPSAAITRQAMAAFLYRLAFDLLELEAPEPPATASFPDAPTDHPFFAEIEWMASTGVTTGYADGTFKPGAQVTRQAMSAFLFRFLEWALAELEGAEGTSGLPGGKDA